MHTLGCSFMHISMCSFEDLVAVLQKEYGLTQAVAEWIANGLQKLLEQRWLGMA